MELDRLIAALEPREVVGERPVDVEDLAYDARTAAPGSLFFCVPGFTADGHDFAADAVARGAAALVVERPLELPVPQLVVWDARAAMAVAADVFFGEPTRSLEVAAVTGTNGKTTTAYLLWHVLEAAGRSPGLLGTIECRVGGESRPVARTTPEAIDLQRAFREMIDAGNESVALEASSHAAELRRLDRVRMDVLVFTNLTQDHLDFHGDMEAYYRAKRRLFTGPVPPPAAVNVADPYGRRLAHELATVARAPLVTYGLAIDAEIRPTALELTAAGIRMEVAGITLESRLRGRFNAENILAAIAAAHLLDIDDDAIVAGVEALAGVPGRFEAIDEGQPFAVIVDYAHTPEALASVLATARELVAPDGRLHVVFGAGGERDRGKRPLMGKAAARLADVVVVTSDNPRSENPLRIIEDVLQGAGLDVEIDPDRRSAIHATIRRARPGDVVVIAGKGHEQGQEIAGETLPFDDREVAREAIRAAARA